MSPNPTHNLQCRTVVILPVSLSNCAQHCTKSCKQETNSTERVKMSGKNNNKTLWDIDGAILIVLKGGHWQGEPL